MLLGVVRLCSSVRATGSGRSVLSFTQAGRACEWRLTAAVIGRGMCANGLFIEGFFVMLLCCYAVCLSVDRRAVTLAI